MKGWVYIISNKAMPGLIKVGYTMKDPELRAAELNHTGSPHPYVVDYEVLVDEPRDIERAVHNRLKNQREGKEWFRCSDEEAIVAIKFIVGSKAQIENFKRADRAKAEAIILQNEEEERVRRAVEEEHRKRQATLDTKRQEIIARYEPLLKNSLPATDFWTYFIGVFVVVIIAANVFFPKMEGSGIFILSVIGTFIATPFVKEYFEEKAKESDQYKSILARRESELAIVENEIAGLSAKKKEIIRYSSKSFQPNYKRNKELAIERTRQELQDEWNKQQS